MKTVRQCSDCSLHFIHVCFPLVLPHSCHYVTEFRQNHCTRAHTHTHPHTSVSHGKRRDTRDKDGAPLRISSEVKLLWGEASHGEGEQTVRTNTANVFF